MIEKGVNALSLIALVLALAGKSNEAQQVSDMAQTFPATLNDIVVAVSGAVAALTKPFFSLGSILKK